MLGFIAIVALSLHYAPHLTRHDIFFGVTVPHGFRNGSPARDIARQYAIEVWLLAAVAAAFVVSSPMPAVSGWMLAVQAMGASVAYARAWSRARPYAVAPATIREAAVGPRDRLPGGLPGQLGPFLMLAAATVYVALNWAAIPDRFPTHWNLAGKADGWTMKSPAGVFRASALGFVMCGMFLFTSYSVLHWARLPRVSGPEGMQHRRVRRANLIALLASAYLVASLLSWAMVFALFSDDPRGLRLPLAIRVAPFALVVLGTATIRAMRRSAVPAGGPVGDTTPDACWWLGRLYVNRQDPALFVERRMGYGYTLNLGNPWAWLVIVVYAVAVAIPLLLVP